MALPLTLSNYAIAYGESEVPVYVYPEKGFLLTSVAMHGFARRECRFLNFIVQRQFSYDDITVLLNIRGVGNVFYVCEGGEWRFLLDESPCNIEAKPYTNNNTFSIEIKTYDGFDDSLPDTIKQAIISYISGFEIGQPLVVPSVYGVCYAAAGDKASTFAISDLTATSPAAGGTTRIRIPADWNALLNTSDELIRITLVSS